MKLRHATGALPLERTAVMGVLNVTPDSFSDGGLWLQPDAALKHAAEMTAAGADLIDVGGESTRPNAAQIDETEELRRVLPVVQGLRGTGALVSIDTRKPAVAERCVSDGAAIVNDTSGEAAVPEMDDVVAASGAGYVIMHSRGTPSEMRELTDYDDVTDHVVAFLKRRAEEAQRAGVQRDAIALDPGFGFAKNANQSVELLARVGRIVELGYPVVIGTSRKSFIGSVLALPEDQRVEGTIATTCWALAQGAQIVRVHDVEPMVRAVRMFEAILAAR